MWKEQQENNIVDMNGEKTFTPVSSILDFLQVLQQEEKNATFSHLFFIKFSVFPIYFLLYSIFLFFCFFLLTQTKLPFFSIQSV